MGDDASGQQAPIKKNWRDYFDIFKYFIPFFVYFIVVWLDNNYASKNDLTQVQLAVNQNTMSVEMAKEDTKDLRTEMFYEVQLIDEKLLAISEDLAEIKKLVEKNEK